MNPKRNDGLFRKRAVSFLLVLFTAFGTCAYSDEGVSERDQGALLQAFESAVNETPDLSFWLQQLKPFYPEDDYKYISGLLEQSLKKREFSVKVEKTKILLDFRGTRVEAQVIDLVAGKVKVNGHLWFYDSSKSARTRATELSQLLATKFLQSSQFELIPSAFAITDAALIAGAGLEVIVSVAALGTLAVVGACVIGDPTSYFSRLGQQNFLGETNRTECLKKMFWRLPRDTALRMMRMVTGTKSKRTESNFEWMELGDRGGVAKPAH
ncbi:MAG: hypothetical protein A2428_12745 [Bdellovibrionales bacterium RIFOXYC1_FULL_54_43]|nr:MAG: hypothetical protein A2428_12745 [Bdellovibrionales bacterium RIFOXYC1_FULL_54_43]OFZ81932.1 MAG: hypothetical protein A2603_04250 [Bdellovibrionales bacterium RIFOXYD1_FULL_55_31]